MSAHARLRIEAILSALRADQPLARAVARALVAHRVAERLDVEAIRRPALEPALRRWRRRAEVEMGAARAHLARVGAGVGEALSIGCVGGADVSAPAVIVLPVIYAERLGYVCLLADVLRDR